MRAEQKRFRTLLDTPVHVECTMRGGIPVCRLPKKGPGAAYPGFKVPTLAEVHRELLGRAPDGPLHDALADCRAVSACLLPLSERIAAADAAAAHAAPERES
jgi:hypothetical protein